MGDRRLRTYNTDIDNLVSNLRGEIGELVSTWVMLRSFMVQAASLRTADIMKDLENPQINMLDALTDKLSDEIVARLAELAEPKIGRLTFYFACAKLNRLEAETAKFAHYVEEHRLQEKRNYDISHKELPEKWTDHKFLHVPYWNIVRGIGAALRLMKKIDDLHLGPRAKYQWQEMRKRRYNIRHPAKVEYMLLPYFWLPHGDRIRIIQEEMNAGRDGWKDVQIKINGKETTTRTYGELGALTLGGRIVLLDAPFVELTSIDIPSEAATT